MSIMASAKAPRRRLGGRMVVPVRTLACLGMAMWLAACEPSASVDASNTQEGVLPATESSKDFGDYVVYFNALKTDQLSADIAREYSIVRSQSRAMLNVSIHRKLPSGQTEAVTGAVSASALNLTGQLETMTLREIREDTAIYYVDVTPSNDPSRFTLRFKKQFFVEK
jgi:hypothetical protein